MSWNDGLISDKTKEFIRKTQDNLLVRIFILVTIVFFVSCILFYAFSGKHMLYAAKVALEKIPLISEKKIQTQLPEDVLGDKDERNNNTIECAFNDNEKWIGKDQFLSQEDTYSPNITENFSEGREMFCNEKIGSDFDASLIFTPLDEKEISVSINYGYIWRVIIGNGDYNQIQAQLNSRWPEQDLSGKDWETQGKDWMSNKILYLKKRTQVQIKILSRVSEVDKRKVHLYITIIGTPVKLQGKREESFDFYIQLPGDSDKISAYLGVGIISSKQKEIKVKFDNPLSIQKTDI